MFVCCLCLFRLDAIFKMEDSVYEMIVGCLGLGVEVVKEIQV